MKKIDNQISEYFCSSEIRKLLESNGCTLGEHRDGLITHALAIEWLRINFGIFISIEQEFRGTFWAQVHVKSDRIIPKWDVVGSITNDFNSPQEATEAALKYVLEELI